MATYNASNASQLQTAIKSAKGGDTIRLAAGSYGKLDLTNKKFSGNVTITSASDTKAKFTSITGTNVANLTLDKLNFEGGGGGWGLRITQSSNMKVTNSTFSKFENGLKFQASSNITVDNNSFTKMFIDAMQFAGLTNADIRNNKYTESGSKAGWTHKDFVQFFTNKSSGATASKNVEISGNQLYAKDGQTHGVLVLNEAKLGMHQNFVIKNNYFKMSNLHGISLADTNGLLIQNNTLVKDGPNYPLINVTPNSQNVKIIGNTAPSVPDIGNKSWSISGNKETAGNAQHWSLKHWTQGQSGTKVANTGSAAGASTSDKAADASTDSGTSGSAALSVKSGGADEIHFSLKDLSKGTNVSTLRGFDFDDRDVLIFHDYQSGTFKQTSGGNALQVSKDGTWARLDSIADLKDLDKASPEISIAVNKAADTVSLVIDQGTSVHKIAMDGLVHDFLL